MPSRPTWCRNLAIVEITCIERYELESSFSTQAAKYSRSTTRSMRISVGVLLSYAVKNGWLKEDPSRGVKLPRVENCAGRRVQAIQPLSAANSGHVLHGVSVKKLTPYPFRVTVRRDAGVMVTGAGPLIGLVFASIVTWLALEKFPSAERSRITVRGSPVPLLSEGACTAWSATMMTTAPSSRFTASTSTVVVSVTFSAKMFCPGGLGNDCPSQ